MSSLFIGVVSHEHTRFRDAHGDMGLANVLCGALTDRGLPTTVHINTQNLLAQSDAQITDELIRSSPAEELRIERAWAEYLGMRMGPRWWAIHTARWTRYAAGRLKAADPRPLMRLINIELSHIDLMKRALSTDSGWVLILEDDAGCASIADLADGLAGLCSGDRTPKFANVSKSFDISQLGLDRILLPLSDITWAGEAERVILAASRPVTNTVCANLYRRDFLTDLVRVLDSLPFEPVAPIDWKLNRALMELFASAAIGPKECWWIEPGPIAQRSMLT